MQKCRVLEITLHIASLAFAQYQSLHPCQSPTLSREIYSERLLELLSFIDHVLNCQYNMPCIEIVYP